MRFDRLLDWSSFAAASAATLAAPWFFGAWEQWWFWPFTCLILAASLLLVIRFATGSVPVPGALSSPGRSGAIAAGLWACFLAYALARAAGADVFMDAERSFLLFLTPALLFAVIALGFSGRQLRTFFLLIIADLGALAAYGIVNHAKTGSSMVMWVRTAYIQYAGRASGSYYCPDHFSGIMELLLAISLAIILLRGRVEVPFARKWGGLQARILAVPLAAAALAGIYISQSRGGLLAAAVVLGFAVLMCTAPLSSPARWAIRAAAAAGACILLVWIWRANPAPVRRFKEYVPDSASSMTARQAADGIAGRLKDSPRYQMYSGALRAWAPAKWFGIGAGMHRHLWFRYAASPDGDRATGKWPSRPNAENHSMEVHSDWIQLLEEYGIVGFVLFGAFMAAFVLFLSRGLRHGKADPLAGGAMLCLAAMAFHSLGDFNLQMPATTWMLAAILAVPSALVARSAE